MTAGTEMVPLLKMPQESSNTVSDTNNLKNKDNTSLKPVHQSDSVRKSLKFTEDNLNNCSDECQNNNKHCTNIASDSKENGLNDNEKIIRKSKFLPAREDDPVLTDQRILAGLLEMEVFYQPQCSNYMSKIQGNHVTPLMRKLVVDWMLEVCESHELRSQVFLLSVQYLDRVLSTRTMDKQQLQLLAASCLFISSKLHDTGACRGGGALSVDKLVICTDCSIKSVQLYNMELNILDILNWELCSITSMEFIHMFIILLNKNINDYQSQSNSSYSTQRLSSNDSFSSTSTSSLSNSFLNTSTCSFNDSFQNSSSTSFQSSASSSSCDSFLNSLRMLLDKKESLLSRTSVLLCLAATEYQFYAVKPSALAAAALSITIKELMGNTEGQSNKETSSNLSQYLNQTLANMIQENKASLIMLENSLRTSLDSWRRSEEGDTSAEFSDYYGSP